MTTWTDYSDADDATFRAVADRIEAAPEAAEAFDAVAALRRVLHFADAYERGEIGDPGRAVVAWMVRVAVHDRTDVAPPTAGREGREWKCSWCRAANPAHVQRCQTCTNKP